MLRNRTAVILLAAVTAILAINTLQSVLADYRDAYSRAQALVVDMAKVVEAHAVLTTEAADRSLLQVAALVRDAGGFGNLQTTSVWNRMREYALPVKGAQSLFIFDETGDAVLESKYFPARSINVAEREYFKVAREHPGLYVGPAVRARTDGSILFTISRRLTDADGNFIGVIAVGMDTEWLTDFYALLGFGMNPTVTVFRRDGTIVARRPDMAGMVGRSNATGPLFREHLPRAPDGFYESLSVLDGRKRLAAYRSIEDTELVIFTGVEATEALAGWRGRALRTVVANALSLVLLVIAVRWGFRYRKREREAKLRLAEAAVVTEQLGAELRQAQKDPLTGLPSRALFLEHAEAMCRRSQRQGVAMAFLYIDLDGFKQINDRSGHDRGDDVLLDVARTLQLVLRDSDLAGRLGGDEFAVCIATSPATIHEVAGQVAARLIARIGMIDDGLGCSIGIAIHSGEQQDVASIMREADFAMYEAKRGGKNRFVFFTPPGNQPAVGPQEGADHQPSLNVAG